MKKGFLRSIIGVSIVITFIAGCGQTKGVKNYEDATIIIQEESTALAGSKTSLKDYGIEPLSSTSSKAQEITVAIQNTEGTVVAETPVKFSIANYKEVLDYEDIELPGDDYVWLLFDLCFEIQDKNLAAELSNRDDYGYIGTSTDYYYNPKEWDDSGYYDDEGRRVHEVNWKGKKCKFYNFNYAFYFNEIGDDNCIYQSYVAAVPVGFDGLVIGVHTSNIVWGSGQYLYDIYDKDEYKLFRLPAAKKPSTDLSAFYLKPNESKNITISIYDFDDNKICDTKAKYYISTYKVTKSLSIDNTDIVVPEEAGYVWISGRMQWAISDTEVVKKLKSMGTNSYWVDGVYIRDGLNVKDTDDNWEEDDKYSDFYAKKITFNGKEDEILELHYVGGDVHDGNCISSDFFIRVPEGYDGLLVMSCAEGCYAYEPLYTWVNKENVAIINFPAVTAK